MGGLAMTGEEKKIITEYFKKNNYPFTESDFKRIEEADMVEEFLEYAKQGKNFGAGIGAIIAYGGF